LLNFSHSAHHCFKIFCAEIFLSAKPLFELAKKNCACAGINITMTWSKYYSPRKLEYWTDSGIEFDTAATNSAVLISQQYLTGIALSGGSLTLAGTRGLVFSDFGIQESQCSEIELTVRSDRLGRIVDDRVQLWNGSAVGANVAQRSSENLQLFTGTVVDYWRSPVVNPNTVNFGVLIDFAPRPDMPSSNPLIVRSIAIRIRS
jgi:hypothetical protein